MRYLGVLAVGIGISAFALSSSPRPDARSENAQASPAEAHGPVVVELFTSEGCSSCPPADSLLLRMDEAHSVGNVEIIALEEHVDYWDGLGWQDPYSSHEWTERQQSYAYAFRQGSVYTPQMVVDGRAEFVGSREGQARQTITELAGKEKAVVAVTTAKSSDGKDRVSARVGKLPAGSAADSSEVWLAITETGLHTAVKRGENAGEDLHHSAVVRTLRKMGVADPKNQETSFTGDANVSLAKSWQRNNLRAVVFVQEKKSQQIVGAAEIKIAQ
jgi:hypothetical protein